MALLQSIILEMFVGKDAEPLYTEKGQFIVKFPACWSRGPEEKLWFDCVIWGNITNNDKPSAQDLGWLASYAYENVKEGDRILVRGRIQGTQDGKPTLWADKAKVVHASYLNLTVQELSITESKANRPAKPAASMPAIEETSQEAVDAQPLKAIGRAVKPTSSNPDVLANYSSTTKS